MPVMSFIRDLFLPRDVTSAPSGWYKAVRATSDSNLYNAFETLEMPPPMELAGSTGYLEPLSPGPGPGTFNTPYAPQAWDAMLVPGMGIPPSTGVGLLQSYEQYGGGQLWYSSDSNPQQELI